MANRSLDKRLNVEEIFVTRSAKDLQQYSLLVTIGNRAMRLCRPCAIVGLTRLIAVLFTGAVLVPSAVALPPANDTQRFNRPLAPFNYKDRFEPAISYEEVRSMELELQGLIGRFQATLLTADANHSGLNISTGELIEQILEQKTVTQKNVKRRFTKSSYQDAHYALQQAQQRLQLFRQLVEQRRYVNAKAEWLEIKEILWDNYPQDRPVAESEIRAMWLDRGTIVRAKSEADLAKVFDRMAIAGINTVFIETLNSSYTIYPSEIAPKNPLIQNWDPLKAAIELARDRGMELHAWIWTFAAVNQRHNEILNLPRNYLGPVLSKHPEWAMTDRRGNRFHHSSGKVFFDPANPEVREYLQSLITEIATNYEVDGIHLDYIRYPFQSHTGEMNYGYSIAARQQFRSQTGIDPARLTPNGVLWSEWTEFRTEQIDSFVAEVSQNLREFRPELTLSTAVFPMEKGDRLYKIQQGWEKWVANEWIDLLVPMTYAKDADRLFSMTSPLLKEFEQGKALLLPGIRLLNMSDVEALDQMQLLRGMSTEGYALFAAENLNSRLASIFSNTQGSGIDDSKHFLPHRKPFEVTLSRFQGLQKEWNYFLLDNSPEIEEAVLKEWGERAERVESTLNDLIEEPSAKNLFSAQIALNSLRRQFPTWVSKTQDIDVYQGRVWQNRLNTLDRILSYGEKKILSDRQ